MRPRMHARQRVSATVLLSLAAVGLAGCGISDPLAELDEPDRPVTLTHPNEMANPPADGQAPPAPRSPAPTPADAVQRFAERYINWNHRTLADVQRELAAMSIEEASATQKRAAARTPGDSELRRGKVANQGRLVAIARAHPRRTGSYVVVTRETTTGARVYDELPPAYHVTLATVSRVRGGWAVSRWEPQS